MKSPPAPHTWCGRWKLYNEERPHQAKGNVPLPEADQEPVILKFPSGAVKCRQRLGGLLKHYYRAAA